MLTADGFDDAILGIADRGPGTPSSHTTSINAFKSSLTATAWSLEEAVEYMDFNVTGAWLGDQTPIFVHLGQPFEYN